MYRSHVLVCGGTGCTSSGSEKIIDALKAELEKNDLTEEVAVVKTGCHGLCALGPIMIVYPEASFYSMVKVEDIPEIVSEHLLKGRVVSRLLYKEMVTEEGLRSLSDTEFYKKQTRIALRNCGVINPENIEEYIGTHGYEALGKALTEMTPEQVIQTMVGFRPARPRRRGLPHRSEVEALLRRNRDERFRIVRRAATPTRATRAHSWTVPFWRATPTWCWRPSAMRRLCHRRLPGLRVHPTTEYPIAVERSAEAPSPRLMRVRPAWVRIFSAPALISTSSLRLGAGAFVCGEETALMTSIRGQARRAPTPVRRSRRLKGLFPASPPFSTMWKLGPISPQI